MGNTEYGNSGLAEQWLAVVRCEGSCAWWQLLLLSHLWLLCEPWEPGESHVSSPVLHLHAPVFPSVVITSSEWNAKRTAQHFSYNNFSKYLLWLGGVSKSDCLLLERLVLSKSCSLTLFCICSYLNICMKRHFFWCIEVTGSDPPVCGLFTFLTVAIVVPAPQHSTSVPCSHHLILMLYLHLSFLSWQPVSSYKVFPFVHRFCFHTWKSLKAFLLFSFLVVTFLPTLCCKCTQTFFYPKTHSLIPLCNSPGRQHVINIYQKKKILQVLFTKSLFCRPIGRWQIRRIWPGEWKWRWRVTNSCVWAPGSQWNLYKTLIIFFLTEL